MTLDQLRDLSRGFQPAVGGPPESAGEELLGGPLVGAVPEVTEPLLQGSNPSHLQVAGLEGLEGRALLRTHGLGPNEPEVLRSRGAIVPGLLQGPVLRFPDLIYGLVKALGDLELVEDDLVLRSFQVRPGRLDIWFPHVHGHGGNRFVLGEGEGGPDAIQALLSPVIGEVQHPT